MGNSNSNSKDQPLYVFTKKLSNPTFLKLKEKYFDHHEAVKQHKFSEIANFSQEQLKSILFIFFMRRSDNGIFKNTIADFNNKSILTKETTHYVLFYGSDEEKDKNKDKFSKIIPQSFRNVHHIAEDSWLQFENIFKHIIKNNKIQEGKIKENESPQSNPPKNDSHSISKINKSFLMTDFSKDLLNAKFQKIFQTMQGKSIKVLLCGPEKSGKKSLETTIRHIFETYDIIEEQSKHSNNKIKLEQNKNNQGNLDSADETIDCEEKKNSQIISERENFSHQLEFKSYLNSKEKITDLIEEVKKSQNRDFFFIILFVFKTSIYFLF